VSWLGTLRFRLRGAWVARFRSYGPAEFAAALEGLGVRRGDVLMVHASLNPHGGYTGTPSQMVAALKEAVGVHGLLVMPSMPYSDSTRAYLQRGEPLRLRTTPSRMGLLSEVFRRGREVRRSPSPGHPLLAWGSRAGDFIEGHERTPHSFGSESPFQRLLDWDGKLLCIDAGLEAITFTHFLEHRHRERLPFALYDPEPLVGRLFDETGMELLVPIYVLSDESRRRRSEMLFWRPAQQRGVVHERRVGNTILRLLRCRDLTTEFDALCESGRHWFNVPADT
jgi:aminoglycoside 3-N-acetyltransferase